MKLFQILAFFFVLVACSSAETIPQEPQITESDIYFPQIDSDEWETISTIELGWNETSKQELITYLNTTNTDSFIILYDGKIAMENYFNGTDQFTNNPWFSAGKTLTAFMVGIAEQENLLNLDDPSSDYLGSGWSSLTTEQENAITVKNHIVMTSGLDYDGDIHCTDVDCLTYLNPPNTQWYYHNATYTLTQSIVADAVNDTFESYFEDKLKSKIGMDGNWVSFGYNTFYRSTARSMARFGLLCLNKGNWNGNQLLNDDYFSAMTNTSQNLNPAYGYLWWLNGKSSYILPGSTISFDGKLIPNAPDDLIAGLGANDKKLYVVPSEKLVVIRLGGSANMDQLGPSSYDDALWEKIMLMIN